ncbi:hypothetical protein OROMI_020642 [Orobanche minor]
MLLVWPFQGVGLKLDDALAFWKAEFSRKSIYQSCGGWKLLSSYQIRIGNRPHDIPLEDFKIFLKYWADEGVQSLAEENAARQNSYADPHTLGRKILVEVKEKLNFATFSSDQDETGTPITQTPGGANS